MAMCRVGAATGTAYAIEYQGGAVPAQIDNGAYRCRQAAVSIYMGTYAYTVKPAVSKDLGSRLVPLLAPPYGFGNFSEYLC
jgi:hypothetical protein